MKRYFPYTLIALAMFIITAFLGASITFAANPLNIVDNPLLNTAATNAGFDVAATNETSLSGAVGTLVYTLLSVSGIVFTLLVIYGGYTWMMARGNEEEVEKGKKVIRHATTGLIVTFSALSIWFFVQTFVFA